MAVPLLVDRISSEMFVPGIARAMDLDRQELAAIAAVAEPDVREHDLALENSGRALHRAASVYGTFTATMNDKAMQAIEMTTAPKFAAFEDEVMQNAPLFERIKAVHDGGELEALDARLVDVMYRGFARRGAALGAADKTRLAEINQQLASLFTTFSQNVLADEETQKLEATARRSRTRARRWSRS